jgi:HEPN domain-containing protein
MGEGEEMKRPSRTITLGSASAAATRLVKRLFARRRPDHARAIPTFAEWLTNVQHIDPATLTAKDRPEWERLYERMKARAAGPLNVEDLQHEYFRMALEYYIAARFSALSFFMPMSGVMFHQAMELYLKGLLCLLLTEKKRTRLGHNLWRAWKKYKSLSKDSSLSRFDARVAGLDRYWGVRYPDEIVRHGIHANIAFEKSPAAAVIGGRNQRHYVLVVEEFDELMAVLWKKSGLNIKAFMPSSDTARECLARWNKWVFW